MLDEKCVVQRGFAGRQPPSEVGVSLPFTEMSHFTT